MYFSEKRLKRHQEILGFLFQSRLVLPSGSSQQIKSQASLDQKLLIEKVEVLIRSEYDKDELLKEVRKDYLDRVQRGTSKIVDKYAPWYSGDISMRYRDNYQLESFFRKIGDVIHETIEEYDKEA